MSLIGRVSKAVAIGAAKKECELRGWPWKEPIRIERFLSRYYVKTNQSMRGGNVHMTVSARDGTIRSANFVRVLRVSNKMNLGGLGDRPGSRRG